MNKCSVEKFSGHKMQKLKNRKQIVLIAVLEYYSFMLNLISIDCKNINGQ